MADVDKILITEFYDAVTGELRCRKCVCCENIITLDRLICVTCERPKAADAVARGVDDQHEPTTRA